MKKLITLIIIALLFLSSCEPGYKPKQSGKLNILSIGISYDDSIGKLSGTIADAIETTMAFTSLARRFNREVGSVELLISDTGTSVDYQNSPAWIKDKTKPSSKANLVEATSALGQSAQDDDLTIVFYSGHGGEYSTNPSQSRLEYPENLREDTYMALWTPGGGIEKITHEDFLGCLSQIKGKVLVIADSCYSGGLISDNGLTFSSTIYKQAPDYWDLLTSYEVNCDPDLYVLSASRSFETSFDNGTNGCFTVMLLDALGWNAATHELKADVPCQIGDRILFSSIYQCIKNTIIFEHQRVSSSSSSLDLVLFEN